MAYESFEIWFFYVLGQQVLNLGECQLREKKTAPTLKTKHLDCYHLCERKRNNLTFAVFWTNARKTANFTRVLCGRRCGWNSERCWYQESRGAEEVVIRLTSCSCSISQGRANAAPRLHTFSCLGDLFVYWSNLPFIAHFRTARLIIGSYIVLEPALSAEFFIVVKLWRSSYVP